MCSKPLAFETVKQARIKVANKDNKKVVVHYNIKCVRNKFFNVASMEQVCPVSFKEGFLRD